MNIKGKYVTLRAVEYEDLDMMRQMLNDAEMEKMVVGWSFPVSSVAQKKWFENSLSDNTNLRFVVELDDGEAIGIATLSGIDWKNRKATHGIKLKNTSNRRKGIGTDVVMSVMRYAFEELNLNRLDGSWFDDNIASQKLYTKCGWQVEGCRRKYMYKGGVYKDLVIVGILKEEYEELVCKNQYWS